MGPSWAECGKESLEQSPPLGHLRHVRTLRTVMLALLALAWVPLTSHCKLAALLHSDLLRCHAEAHASPGGSDPCHNEPCCQVETAKYHPPRQQDLIPVVDGIIKSLPEFETTHLSARLNPQVSLLTAAPPGFSSCWSFTHRTALPVRAPSSRS